MRQPPGAPVSPVTDVYFGAAVDDPYRWMEEESGRFGTWLDGQAEYARGLLDALPYRDELYARLRQLRAGQGVRRHGVSVRGERVFYLRAEPGAGVPVLVVADADPGAPERVLLDPNAARGAHHSLDWYVPSPDGHHVACGTSAGGSERSALRVVDVTGGGLLPDTVDGVWFPFVSWLDDGESLVYHRFLPPPAGAPPDARRLGSRSLRHRLGADPATDEVVLAGGLNPRVPVRPLDRPFVYRPPGSPWTIAVVSHGALRPGRTDEALSDCTLYVAPTTGLESPAGCPWRVVARPEDGVSAFALGPDTIYLVTHSRAPRRRVLAVPLAGGEPSVLVPESDRVVEAVRVVGEHLLVRDLDGGVARLRRVPLTGGAAEEITLPVSGTIREWAGAPGSAGLLLGIESWTSPLRHYRYQAGSGAVVSAQVGPVPHDTGGGTAVAGGLFAGVEAYQVLAVARDGTPVPVSLIHRRGLARDGNNPVWLEGYGSHGVPLTPGYEPYRLAWLERGGVWAVAHLRGGGEYGRGWHEAGRRSTKENTITDLIDCAEYLVAQGYTRPGRLVGAGTSAGGIPAGGALVRRPDLWAAMVLRVPVVNTLRIELTENGPVHIPEYGSASTEDGVRSLLACDAYHRVRDGVAYPPVLLTAGRNDSRVPPWQPGKLAARLQAAAPPGRGGPTVLRVEDAGHGFGSTAEQQDAEQADVLAFALAAVAGRIG